MTIADLISMLSTMPPHLSVIDDNGHAIIDAKVMNLTSWGNRCVLETERLE